VALHNQLKRPNRAAGKSSPRGARFEFRAKSHQAALIRSASFSHYNFVGREIEKPVEAKLVPIDGGKPIRISRDVTVVGRGRELCDLLIDHSSISKLQCLIAKTDGLLFVRDLGSTNGTKVNGQRITRGALLPGDELAFASVKFRVHLGPSLPIAEGEAGNDERTSLLEIREPLNEEYDLDAQSSSDVRFLSDDSAVS
jgi:pSer/pThr/pTyr-binding forkhead associated (FHA) protein